MRTTWLPLLLLCAAAACDRSADTDSAAAQDVRQEASDSLSIAAGFATPESVLHDAAADVYLVSNINGDPFGRTGDGFISRVRPDGSVEAERWIDGSTGTVTLHAPKGLALKGDTLFVADIDTVRAFHRTSGEPLAAFGVPGATFLNDLAVAGDGTLYVSDSGLATGFEPSGTDAVYAFHDGQPHAIARGEVLARPNGLAVDGRDIIAVSFGGSAVLRIAPGAEPRVIAELPAGELDGVVRLDDGSFLISSWAGQAVYRLHADGRVATIVDGVQAPADIGFDEQRRRVLIPLFMDDRVEVRPIP